MEPAPEQSRKIRRLGWVLAGMGVVLVVLMGSITFIMADVVTESGSPGAGTR